MPFASPLALLGLLFVPAVVAMYLLRLRRTPTVVPSTLLWQRLAADVEANAPWQRLRRSLLFLLQLLLVVVIALLAARPFLERPAGLARDIVLIVDTSASMGATDVEPDRLGAARAAAVEALKDLPAGGKVSVIEAGRTARIVAAGTSDLGRVRQAIDSIRPSTSRGDLGDALALAQQLAVQSGDAEVLVATDAALAVPPTTRVDAPIHVLRVGDAKGSRNQAIVALAVRTAPSGVSRSMIPAGPPNAPTGRPPPITLPSAVRSGRIPNNSCAPARATRKPVITSSKIRSAPCRSHSSRSPWRKFSRGK